MVNVNIPNLKERLSKLESSDDPELRGLAKDVGVYLMVLETFRDTVCDAVPEAEGFTEILRLIQNGRDYAKGLEDHIIEVEGPVSGATTPEGSSQIPA